MTTVGLADARRRLSELIDRVQAGEAFSITRRGKVVAYLGSPPGREAAKAAVARVRSIRQGVSRGRVRSSRLMAEGRR